MTAARPRGEGENPVSFIAQLQDTHNPYNPFMTIIVLPCDVPNGTGFEMRTALDQGGSVCGREW